MPEGMSADDFNVFARLVLQTDPEQVSQEMRTVVGSIFDSFEQSIPKMRKEGERMGAAQAEGVAAGYAGEADAGEKRLEEALKRQQATRDAYFKASLEQQRIALMRLSAAAAAADKAALEAQKDANIRRHQAQQTFDRQYLQELDDTLKQGRRLENEALWKQLEADRIEHKLRLEQRRALDSKNLAITKSFLADLARLEAAEYREGNRQANEAGQKRVAQERADLREGERLRKAAEARRMAERKADLAEGARQEKERAAKEQVILRASEQAKNQAARAAEARRLQEAKAAHGKSIQEAQIAGAKELQIARADAREKQIAMSAGLSRANIRARAFFTALNSTYRFGLRSISMLWTAHFRKRDIELKGAQARELEITKEGLARETAAIRNAQRTRDRTNAGVIGAVSGRSSVGNSLQTLLAYAGGGFLVKSIAAEATEAIKVQRSTAAVIKSTGGVAGVTAKHVDDLANSISRLAGVDDETVASAENLLLTFTNIRNIGKDRIFDQATKSLVDMSTVLSPEKFKTASLQVGRALNDPIRGITALRRAGVSFTQQQQDQIKVLVKSGNVVGAQKIILAELRTEFEGQAKAQATWGAKLKVTVKNIEEAIGLALYPTVSKALKGLTGFLENLAFGKGAWKVIRDGLIGIAIGLSAVFAVKGAIEVIGLLGQALATLASSPALLALSTLGALAGVAYTLAKNYGPVRAFFSALYEGTKNWIEVGYKIAAPIESLSKMVLVQSTVGAVARTARDSLKSIGQSVIALVHGDFGKAKDLLLGVILNFGRVLAPLGRVILDGLKAAVGYAARGVGGFLQGAFGTGGLIGRLVGETPVSEAAAAVGKKLRSIVALVASNAAGFISGVRGGQSLIEHIVAGGGDATAAQKVGARIRSIVGSALSGAGAAFSALGSTIARLFTSYVLPKLIELPRILGRFLSRTLFSRGFLNAGRGVVIIAAIIAAQFVRGFAEGIYERRNEIAGFLVETLKWALAFALVAAKTIAKDILPAIVKGMVGSGNPFLVLATLLSAAFAAAKIKKAISSPLSEFAAKAKGAASSINDAIDSVPFHVMKVGDKIKGLGDKVLKTTGLLTNSAGRLYKLDPFTNQASFVKDPTKDLSRFRVAVGQTMVKVGQSVRDFGLRASETWQNFKQKGRDAFEKVKENGGAIALATTGLVSGYFTSMADTAEAKTISVLTSVGSIAGAFAVGGPVVGGITAVATAIGFVYGQVKKNSDAVKAKAAEVAAAYKAAGDEARASFYETFKAKGNTGPSARFAAISEYLKSQNEKNTAGLRQFVGRFKGSFLEAERAAERGTKSISRYLDRLVVKQEKALLGGSATSLKGFKKEVREAGEAATKGFNVIANSRSPKVLSDDTLSRMETLNKELTEGKIGWDKYRDSMRKLGVDSRTLNEAGITFKNVLDAGLRGSAGGRLIASMADQLGAAAAKAKILQDLLAQDQENGGTFADKVSGAWGRISTSISEATRKVRDFFDAQSGKKRTDLQTRVDLLGAAKDAAGKGPVERELAVLNSAAGTSDILQQLAAGSASVEDLRGKVDRYFATLEAGRSKAERAYLEDVRKQVTEDALKTAFDARPAIKNVTELKTKLIDFLRSNNPDLLSKIDTEKDPKKRLELLKVAMLQFEREDHTVKVYVEKSSSFDEVLLGLRRRLSEPITIPVVIDPSFSQNGLNLFGTQILPPKRGLAVPPPRNPDAYAGKGNALGGYYTRQHLSTIAEGGRPEAIFPLTNQPRMRQIAAIPQVRSALAAVLPSPTDFGGSGPTTVVNHEVNVEQTIVEAAHPRLTASESVRGIRKAQFLGGATLATVGPRT